MDFTMLTRKHGLKICPGFPCSVEECGLAVAEIVGADSIKSAARMNGAVVIFVDEVAKANAVIANGIVINDTFVSVLPLASPSRRVTVSNVPPFISDDVLERELSRHGKIVSPIKKMLSGCKSPVLQHVVSHRRQLFMILKNSATDFAVTFRLKIDGIDYVLFATSDVMRCFNCGKEGHVIRVCPEKPAVPGQSDRSAGEGTSGMNMGGGKGKISVNAKDKEIRAVPEINEMMKNAGGDSEEKGEEVIQASGPEQKSTVVDDIEVDGSEEEGEEEGGGGEEVKESSKAAEDRLVEPLVESEAVDMEDEVGSCASSRQKRKSGDMNNSGSTAKKATVTVMKKKDEQFEEDDTAESDSTFEGFEEEVYEVEAIKLFLKETKNTTQQRVKLRNYFPDKELFVASVRAHMKMKGNAGFTEQEGHRLKKMVGVISKEINGKDGEKQT